MQNKNLAQDHISRAQKRLLAIKTLFDNDAWADVVRESQEAVELALKGLLRKCNIEVPRIHDVSGILEAESSKLPKVLKDKIPRLAQISKDLRRDRELAFYGSEDLTPSEFYGQKEAKEAFEKASFVIKTVSSHFK